MPYAALSLFFSTMSSFVYLYSLYVHMFKLYLSVFVRLLSVFNVNCMHQGSESYAISFLCLYCCTCGRIDNKADFDFDKRAPILISSPQGALVNVCFPKRALVQTSFLHGAPKPIFPPQVAPMHASLQEEQSSQSSRNKRPCPWSTDHSVSPTQSRSYGWGPTHFHLWPTQREVCNFTNGCNLLNNTNKSLISL